jgi:hypothetical protein
LQADQRKHESRNPRAEVDQLASRRQRCDLPFDEFEVAPSEVPLVKLRRVSQVHIQLVFVHASGMPDDG